MLLSLRFARVPQYGYYDSGSLDVPNRFGVIAKVHKFAFGPARTVLGINPHRADGGLVQGFPVSWRALAVIGWAQGGLPVRVILAPEKRLRAVRLR